MRKYPRKILRKDGIKQTYYMTKKTLLKKYPKYDRKQRAWTSLKKVETETSYKPDENAYWSEGTYTYTSNKKGTEQLRVSIVSKGKITESEIEKALRIAADKMIYSGYSKNFVESLQESSQGFDVNNPTSESATEEWRSSFIIGKVVKQEWIWKRK